MSHDLDVSLRLRLINLMAGGARDAIGDLKGVENAAQAVNRAGFAQSGKIPAHIWVEQQRQIKAAAAEAENFATQIGAANVAMDGLAGSVGAFVAARTGLKLLRDEVSAGATAVDNAISMETAGYSPAQIDQARDAAAKISSKYGLFTRSQIEEQIADTTPALGSLAHSLEVQDLLARFRTIQEGQRPGSSSATGLTFIVKALEEAGAANDVKKFRDYLEQMAKLTNTFKGTIRDEDWYGFFKRAGTLAGKSMSLDYVGGAGATFVNTVGGDTAGVSERQFYQSVVGSFMMPKSAQAFVDLGLVPDKSKILLDSKGGIKGLKPGAIAGQHLAKTDPYQWVQTVLIPALEAKGLSEDEQDETLSGLFLNPNARNLVEFLKLNKARIEKDKRLKEQAKGLDAADTWQEKSPTVARKSGGQQLENTFREGGEPLMGAYAKFFHSIRDELDWWNTNIGDKHAWATPLASGAAVLGAGALSKRLAAYGLKRGARFLRSIQDAPTGAPEAVPAPAAPKPAPPEGVFGKPGSLAEFAKGAAEAAENPKLALASTMITSLFKGAVASVVFALVEAGVTKAVDAQGRAMQGAVLDRRFGEDEAAKAAAKTRADAIMKRGLLGDIKALWQGSDAAKAPADAAQATMAKYAAALPAAEGPAVAAIEAFVARIKARLEFTAEPTIAPRLITPNGAPAPRPAPQKHARNGGNVYIQHAAFNGVNDPKKLHDAVMARANRDSANANFASLHDIDIGGTG